MGKKKRSNDHSREMLMMGIKKDEEEIRKYEILLKIKKKKKSVLSDIFSTLDAEMSDEDEERTAESGDEEEEDESMGEGGEDEGGEEAEEGSEDMDEESEEVEDIPQPRTLPTAKGKETANELHVKIKRNLLQHLNKLCEAQMMKCLDGVEVVWKTFPRGDVRDVFIKESLPYMTLNCLDLAVLVVQLHARLAKHTNLIAFYMEHLVDKMGAFTAAQWHEDKAYSTLLAFYKFTAYVTRLEALDCTLAMDLLDELVGAAELPRLKVAAEVASIMGFYARKRSGARCESVVAALRAAPVSRDAGDMDEVRSYGDAVVTKLTSSKAKSDVAAESVERYRRLCRGGGRVEPVALSLGDLRGATRVRWWLVGSGVAPGPVLGKAEGARAAPADEDDERWTAEARALGLATAGKQALFCTLMRARRDHEDDVGGALAALLRLTGGGLSEAEAVRVLVRLVALETGPSLWLVAVLAGLLESHRRFRQMVKEAVWDLLAHPRLAASARTNLGRCVGALVAGAGLPVTALRKHSFTTEDGRPFMLAVVTELLDESWEGLARILSQMAASVSPKFAGNLGRFIARHVLAPGVELGRAHASRAAKAVELLQELRRGA